MKLFNIMDGFKVMGFRWAARCHTALKKNVVAGIVMLTFSAGAVYGQTENPDATIVPNYTAETLTLGCTDNTYTTFYWTIDETDPQLLYDPDWEGTSTLQVSEFPENTIVIVRAMKMVEGNPMWSDPETLSIVRYTAPQVSANYGTISNHIFSVANPNTTDATTTVRYAVGTVPDNSSVSVSDGSVNVTEYYTTYNFRVFGSSKFPSENVEVRTNRYNPPAILNYVPYTAASATDNEIPASGTFVMDNGSTVYINYSHTSSGSSELMDPDPSNTNTYDITIEAGQTFPTGFHAQNFKMVVGNSSAANMFPSTVVTVDENYSCYYVVQYGEGTARRYLSLDSTSQRIYGKQVFDRSCLWQPDAQGRLGQPLGSTTYYLSVNNGEIATTTGANSINWYFNTDEQALMRRSDYSGVAYMPSGDRWVPTSGTTAAQLYAVKKRHSVSGTVDMITSFTLDAIQYNGQSPTWIAIADGDGPYTLSVKPNVTVTTYRLPAHDHYSYTDQSDHEVDFTYFPLYNRSYTDHFQLPFSSEVGSNSNVYVDNVEVQWTVENESAAALTHTQPQLSTTSNGTTLSSVSLSRNGAITAPQTAQVTVTATYTIGNTLPGGETVYSSRTAASRTLKVFAEQHATNLTALTSTGTESQAFASGQLYLLTNYAEKDESNVGRHYLTVTGEGAPTLMQEEDADRAFVVVQNNDQLGTYMFTSATTRNRLGFDGELASVYTDNTASMQCGALGNDNQGKYIITPYIDGSNTYFTIRPYNVNDNISSLTPYLGANDEGGVADASLRLVNAQSSSYSRQQSDVTADYDFGDVFFATSRWQLVEAKLYPPTVHMAPDGTITLTDEVNTARGLAGSDYSMYYKIKPHGGTWPEDGTQYTTTTQPRLDAGDELEAWIAANAGGDYSYMGSSASVFFVARQVATPQAVVNGNTISFEAEEGATVYYSLSAAACTDMGNTPEANSSVSAYTTPLEYSFAGNICYCAYAPDCIKSEMCSLYHRAVLPLEISEPDNNSNVTLSIANNQIPGEYYDIYYTTDGSEPTRSPELLYSSGASIPLCGFTILKAKAFSNNDNYLDSPIKTYYHNSQYLVFTYKAGTEENVGENMMLLATGSNNATNSENAIDGTLLWIGPNTYQETGAPIYNEATSSYLTFTLPQDGVIVPYGTSAASEARLWQWGGETGSNGYNLYTVDNGTTYYLAYNAAATENKWRIVTAAGSGDNLDVAYRADMTEYAGGYEFAAEGVNLFMGDVALANDNTAWVALSEGEAANLRVSLNGTMTTIDANTNINIYKNGSLWQRWHRKDENYYQSHTAVGLATSEPQTDFFDPDSASNWAWTLNATNYFTLPDAGDDVSHNTVTRTTNGVSTPDFGSLLTVTYTPNNAYADAAASSVDLHLYAESRNTTSVAGEWRFANKSNNEYLSIDPDTRVVMANDNFAYLSSEPIIATHDQYTQYAVWTLSASGNYYSIQNQAYTQCSIYHHTGAPNALYLYDPQSNAVFNYLHRSPAPQNPVEGTNSSRLKYQVKQYGTGDNLYITFSPSSDGTLALAADNSWQPLSYGDGHEAMGASQFHSRRWKAEQAPLTPPAINMDPLGNVTLSHLTEDGTPTYYYTLDGTDPTASSTLYTAPIVLEEGQTIKAITVQGSNTSSYSSLTAVRTPSPNWADQEGGAIMARTDDSIVVGVNRSTVNWNSEGLGIYHYGNTVNDYNNYYSAGNVLTVIAYRHNQLQSVPFYYTTNLQLVIAVDNVAINADNTADVAFQVTSTNANIMPRAEYYRIYYTIDGTEPSLASTCLGASDNVANTSLHLTGVNSIITVKAKVVPISGFEECYTASSSITQYIIPSGYTQDLTQDGNVYLINNALDLVTVANNCNGANAATWLSASYKVTDDIDLTGISLPSIGGLTSQNLSSNQPQAFQGHWDGGYKVISHASQPLFMACSNAHVYNVVIANSEIITTESGAWGAICATACGSTRIYNSGVRSTSTVSGGGRTGGLVGVLYGNSRVVNCYNFASVSSSNSNVGGIVGYQNSASNRTSASCLIFNCMNYGRVSNTGGQQVSPISAGNTTKSGDNGLNTYNYFLLDVNNINELNNINYNGALAVDKEYLTRHEFYRLILNSNRKKCGRWVNADAYTEGSFTDVVADDGDTIGTWVLDPNIAPYPVVLPKYEWNGTARAVKVYPSIINPDYANASESAPAYQGKKLGTLSVAVNGGTYASSSSGSLTLNITDMDTTAYDYTYRKVQLPYFQDVFGVGSNVVTSDNSDYIVTGWKITGVTGGTEGSYVTTGVNAYNFADRDCTSKDVYSVSGRVFAQGGYYMVPNDVTAITIEAYWGKAIYLGETANESAYNSNNTAVTPLGGLYGTCSTTYHGQTVQNSISNALGQLANVSTVYDQAIVLLTDYHVNDAGKIFYTNGTDKPFTIMSIDEDNDHEPDHCLFQSYVGRKAINPIRFDMLVHAGFNMAGLPNNKLPRDLTICLLRGHFEITETALAHYSQFEYDHRGGDNGIKTLAPLILNGGMFDQIVSGENKPNIPSNRTQFIQLGGHVWFKMFSPGAHGNNNTTVGKQTYHCPVTVTGGEYKKFYLSGVFRSEALPMSGDAPCLYACGGKFGHYASAGHDKIGGDVTVKADHIIADEFYGGGINPANPIDGNINITLNNSIVGLYAAGPKFGNMPENKKVTTHAVGTTFGTYYGAGYGGTGLGMSFEEEMSDAKTYSNNIITNYYNNKRGKFGSGGIAIDYEFDFMQQTGGASNTVRRIYTYRAELSKAETYDVESTLENCTVNNDYYGAGYVGRVLGIAKSTLDNCTIHGNVYAGGNSSTAPKAKVYPAIDLNDKPTLITTVYYMPEKPEATLYTWTTNTSQSYTTDERELDENNLLIYTNKSLDDMGQADATQLTITGNTVVEGSVFGGGNLADVGNNDTRNDNNVEVNIESGYMRSVYGGGNEGSIVGSTVVNITGGHIGYRPSRDASGGDIAIQPEKGRDRRFFGVYGGGFGIGTTVTGTATVNIGAASDMIDNVYVNGSVFGGGEAGQVGGGYRHVHPNAGTTLSGNYYKYDFSNDIFVACSSSETASDGTDYYVYENPVFGEGNCTQVNVLSDGVKSTEIKGAVFGGGRGYYLNSDEEDYAFLGSEVEFTLPIAGAVYGNIQVNVGTVNQDTTWVKIGSLRYLADNDMYTDFGLINPDDPTLSAIAYWGDKLYVYDVVKRRYVSLTSGENTATDIDVRTKNGGHKVINASRTTMDDEVEYYLSVGRVAVAGGGERGTVYNSTAFSSSNILLGNESNRYSTEATGGNCEVNIYSGILGDELDGVVGGDVFGSGLNASIDGVSHCVVDGATAWVRGDLYGGGCMGTNHAYRRGSENDDADAITVEVKKGWIRNVHGGSNLAELLEHCNSVLIVGEETEANSGNSTTTDANDQLLVSESVYGGSGLSPMHGVTNVTVHSGKIGFVKEGYAINSSEEGNDEPTGTIVPNGDRKLPYEGNVYGSGYGPKACVKRSSVTVNGGIIKVGVFGGGELAAVGDINADNATGDGIGTYTYTSYDERNGSTVSFNKYYLPQQGDNPSEEGYVSDVRILGGQMSSVYGGGRGYSDFLNVHSTTPGTIMGNVSVVIGGGVIDTTYYSAGLGGGNVYGGGLEGEVTGDTRVEITDGTVQCHAFAGGRGYRGDMLKVPELSTATDNILNHASRQAGWVMGNTNLTVSGDNTVVGLGLYGGGEGMNYVTNGQEDIVAVVNGNARVEITGGTIGGGYQKGTDLRCGSYAGGRVAPVNGYADMLVSGTVNIAAVYGGNDVSGRVKGARAEGSVDSKNYPLPTEPGCTYVRIEGTPRIGHVYGGGNGQYGYYTDAVYNHLNLRKRNTNSIFMGKPVQAMTYVDIDMAAGGRIDAVFGGGNSAEVGNAKVFYYGAGVVDTLFAGGNSATVTTSATATVWKDATVNATTDPTTQTDGEGRTNAPTRQMEGAGDTQTEDINYLFGGNNMATMTILPTLDLKKGIIGKVYGGGNMGDMEASESREDVFEREVPGLSTYVLVNSEDVTITEGLFGGCNNAKVKYGTYVDVRLTSEEGINQLFGGNDISETVGTTRIDVIDGTIREIYGGSNGNYLYTRSGAAWDVALKNDPSTVVALNSMGRPTVGETHVNIWGGTIGSSVYGGGLAGDCGNTYVEVNDTVNGRTASAVINGKIFGGGYGDETLVPHVGNVTGSTHVNLRNVMTLAHAYVYGGGEAGDVHDAEVNVWEGWNQSLVALYGGCWGSDVTGTATVNMRCAESDNGYNVTELYGGNDYSGNVANSVLNIYSGKYNHVFGAGNGAYDYSNSTSTFNQAPNSVNPTINFYDGTVMGTLYGGGNRGTCIKGTEASANVADYAHVVVNIHGGEFKNDIFTGAAGEQGGDRLVQGLKQLNMDGGNVANSVYGGSESVDDGYPECVSSANTTQRPSTIMNIVGGRVRNHVYGGGYLAKVHGSVYVNVGKEAVEDSPVWTNTYNGTNSAYNDFKPAFVTVDEENVGSSLKPHDLYLEASIYAGANWGDASTGSPDFTTAGFYGGESRIFIDGAGYNTTLETTTTTDDPIMNIYYSLIGAGTSCEGGDVLRHIMVRNYGKYDNCTPSRELFSIQRADTVWLQDVALRLLGDQDASSAYPSTRYSINRVGHLLMKGYNMLEVTTPVARVGELEFLTDDGVALQPSSTEALSAMRSSLTTDCSASNCQKLEAAVNPISRRYSALLVTNGVPIDIINENGAWGAVKGYGFLLSEDGTQAIVSARRKTTGVNETDGGFFSGCSTENNYTNDGAYADGELTFTNETSGTTRAWKLGHGVRSRQLTILAHANVGNLPDINKIFDNGGETDYPLALAKGTLELPATVPGHYYVITGGVQVDQANGEMRLTDCAFNPSNFNTTVAPDLVPGTWITVNGATTPTHAEVEALIRQNANSTFGLLMTAGNNFGTDYSTATPISANQYFSQLSSSYRTASVTGSGETAEVRPTLDFYLTYCTNFATTIFGDVTFDLVEMDEDGPVGDTIRVTVSVSTLIDMFRDQSYELVAVHNDYGNNTYSRKLVLPSTLQRRELYLTQIEWAPMDNDNMRPAHASDPANGNTTNFKLTTWGTAPTSLENDKFTLKMDPTEQLSASLTTTLGWARIEQNDLDVFTTAGGTGSSSTLTCSFGGFNSAEGAVNTPDNLGLFMGVLDGRSSAAIDLTMGFNGAATYASGYKGRVILTFEYYNSGSYREKQEFRVTLYIRTRDHGDTIYVASNTSIERGGRIIEYSQSTGDNDRGKRPAVYLDKFQRAFDENIYQPGDVFCVLDEVRISDNLVIHGSDYNLIPVVRYEGHHSDFPGRACAYTDGPMISIINQGRLSVDNMIFDGSKYSSYIVDPTSDLTVKAMGPMSVSAPIFNVTDHGQLILGNGTYVQNNSNQYTGGTGETGMWGGAIRVEGTGAMLLLNNSVTIQNNLVADGVASGAVHLYGGEMKLGVANSGTSVQIVDNYHLPENTSPETVSAEWNKANVYLTREEGLSNNPLVDGISDIITFENAIAPDTRIGISKEFPGETVRDTIMVARLTGSQVQYAGQAYENNNFFDDNTGRNVFYHATISPNTLYFQRCATFQKQVYGADLVYNYRSNNELATLTNGTQLPVMTYLWNRYAACPDETDSMIYSVHGGFYPYQYEWSWSNTSADNLDVFRTYSTQTQSRPYSNVAVSAGLAEGNYVPATSSNSDTAALYGTKGNQGTFYYRVTATDLAGCEQTTNFQVKLMQSSDPNASYGVTLTAPDPIDQDDDELKYSWDVSDDTLKAQHIYKGIHLIANVHPTGWGTVVGNIDGDASATVRLTEGTATQLCPGDAIRLNATANDNHNFIQWDFDPYDQPSTVFVMPHSGEDIRVNAYFGPNDYWKDVVREEPSSGITFDYNGDVHITGTDGLAWLISLTNGLNDQQIHNFYYNTIYIEAGTYDMSAHLWTPLGTQQHKFMGTLQVSDGVNITGITVNEPGMNHVGFFAYLENATVSGLKLGNSLFHGSQYVGGIAAEALNSTIQNSVVGSEYTATTTGGDNTETGDNTDNGKDGEGQTTSGGSDVTTIITANYTSGGLVGNATDCTIEGCEANAIYMGATIYNGGILGFGQAVDATNSFVCFLPRMSSLYSSGIVGSIDGPDNDGSKSGTGSRIANNYVYFAPNYATLNRVGGLVGHARNTTLENNYVYGSTQGGILTGALGAVLDRGVTVSNCYYERGSNDAAFGFSGTGNHTAGVTTFNGTGNQVMMADRVDGSNNLTLALNRWVRGHEGEGFATWRSDLEGSNHGYPRFGEPDMVPVYENISYETCDSLSFAGETLTESGMYEFHVVDSADFVDSTVTLDLTIHYSTLTELLDSVLMGDDYQDNGFLLTATEIELLSQAMHQEERVVVVISDTLQTLYGCDSVVTLYLTVNPRGVPEPSEPVDLKVYPNPTIGQVTVRTPDMCEVELYDGVSRLLFTKAVKGDSCVLDLSAYPSGTYYIRVRTSHDIIIKKVIKQ